MSEPMLLFETDPHLGTPKLTPFPGAARVFSAKEMRQLEEQLRPRYEGLVRDGDGTLDFKGETLFVRKKDGDTSRQPTLELRLATADSARPTPSAPNRFPTPEPRSAVDWRIGLLDEMERLFSTPEFDALLPVEKAMLGLVRDELQELLQKNFSEEAALLVLVSILVTAEQLSRTQRPNEPHPYAYALSGVERLLSQTSAKPTTPWGRLPARLNTEPAPSWLCRFWPWLRSAT